jgi:putative dimethyl sulfoxide reductase chaperone
MKEPMKTPQAHRANLYRITADCFKYPDFSLKEALRMLPQETERYHPSLKKQGEDLLQAFPEDSEGMRPLEVEYARLFVGPFQVVAPPYSSVYSGNEPRMMGESTQTAIDFYLQAGLDPSETNKEPPDHISTELEFLYYLVFKFVESQDRRFTQLADSFLDHHVRHWVPSFIQRLKQGTQVTFYQKLSDLLNDFMTLELKS